MYVIIVYDIKVERVNKVKSFLRQYLFWIQNSVFEGESSESEFKIIYDGFYILFRCKTINLDKAIQLAKKEAIKNSRKNNRNNY